MTWYTIDSKFVKDHKILIEWNEKDSGNCGILSLYEFVCGYTSTKPQNPLRSWESPPLMRPRGFSEDETVLHLQKELKLALPSISARIKSPLVYLSDRVAGGDAYAGFFLKTRDLMQALIKNKYGRVTISPIVENPVHPGISAIAAALWVPPSGEKLIIYDKPVSRGFKGIVRSQKNLDTSVKSVVRDWYGREIS